MIGSDEDIIRGIVQDLNTAWLQGQPQDIGAWLHPDVVIVEPGFTGRHRGSATAVASYAAFVEAATVQSVELDPPEVEVWESTAVASCHYTLDYTVAGEHHHDAGWDVLVFARTPDGWRAVWRTLLPDPPGSAEAEPEAEAE